MENVGDLEGIRSDDLVLNVGLHFVFKKGKKKKNIVELDMTPQRVSHLSRNYSNKRLQ